MFKVRQKGFIFVLDKRKNHF